MREIEGESRGCVCVCVCCIARTAEHYRPSRAGADRRVPLAAGLSPSSEKPPPGFAPARIISRALQTTAAAAAALVRPNKLLSPPPPLYCYYH